MKNGNGNGDQVRQLNEELQERIRSHTRDLEVLTSELASEVLRRQQTEERLRKTELELAHVSRMLPMSEMVASIAHEVSQPLAAVLTNASASLAWLDGTPPRLSEARAALERIIADSRRASEVIHRIRSLFKRAQPQMLPLDVNQLIEEVVGLTTPEIRKNCLTLRTALAPNLPPVRGDRVQLQQVLMNLIRNAVEAMSDGRGGHRGDRSQGRAALSGDRPSPAAGALTITTGQTEPGVITIAVRDSGVGVDADTLPRLFDAFFSTKPNGMGMGLAISKSIVEAHGGRLWTTPHSGMGATFIFCLPSIPTGS